MRRIWAISAIAAPIVLPFGISASAQADMAQVRVDPSANRAGVPDLAIQLRRSSGCAQSGASRTHHHLCGPRDALASWPCGLRTIECERARHASALYLCAIRKRISGNAHFPRAARRP